MPPHWDTRPPNAICDRTLWLSQAPKKLISFRYVHSQNTANHTAVIKAVRSLRVSVF